ncbi:MAG: hypothetical protein LBL74_07240 [Bacteroidales bacterium]|jgi:hypothetical protein|nr:hypothetical protein [Bacteroidales bacterium]
MYKRGLTAAIALLMLLVGCKKEEKFVDKTTGKPLNIKIIRFDEALFGQKHTNQTLYFDTLIKDYSDLMDTNIPKKNLYMLLSNTVADTIMQQGWKAVNKMYPSFDWLEKKLNTGFAELQKNYPQTHLPKIYSMISGPIDYQTGYERRVYADANCIIIAADWYAMTILKDKPFYNQIPKYLCKVLDSAYIAADVIKAYLKQVTTINMPLASMSGDADLLSLMIESGKFNYAAQKLLGCTEQEVLRYTDKELQWCQKNEANIWGYFIQNKLLFEKEPIKYRGLLFDAPSSRGMQGSPARVAEYIGYRIVCEYAKQNKISIQDLFSLTKAEDIGKEANRILNESGFKPKKR